LVFFKLLSDVFEDEFAAHVKEYGDKILPGLLQVLHYPKTFAANVSKPPRR
jgi:hypothetical protein